MAKRKGGRRIGGLVVITLISIAVVAAVWIGTSGDDSVPSAPATAPEPESPAEPDLPGEPFEASGTMLALPGAPNLPINLWSHPDRSAGVVRVVGQLSRGQGVTITRRYQHFEEEQFYYRVASGELVGWVPETLVAVGQ